MARIDPLNDSIRRFVIMRHCYDPDTNCIRWIYESAFDSEREFKKALRTAELELTARENLGNAHPKEQLKGEILEINHFKDAKLRRTSMSNIAEYSVETRISFLQNLFLRRIKSWWNI